MTFPLDGNTLNLLVSRTELSDDSTMGDLYLDGRHFCYTLEDVVRIDDPSTPQDEGEKVYGQTAIPAGTYEVELKMSPKRGYVVPWLINVPYFKHVQIHPGNTAEDSLGCILVGFKKGPDVIYSSRAAFDALMQRLTDCVNADGKIFLTVENAFLG